MKVKTCKCGLDADNCRCEVPGEYRISVSQAILRWYESADRCGQFGLYSLLDFVRTLVGRQVSDSRLLPTIMHNEGIAFLGGPLRSSETWCGTSRLSHRLIGYFKGWKQRENNARTKLKVACHPTFAEWMMNWPETWSDLSASATDKFRLWLRSHGKYSEVENE